MPTELVLQDLVFDVDLLESRKHLLIVELAVVARDILFGRMMVDVGSDMMADTVVDMDLRILVGHIGCLLVVVAVALGDIIDQVALLGDILRIGVLLVHLNFRNNHVLMLLKKMLFKTIELRERE